MRAPLPFKRNDFHELFPDDSHGRLVAGWGL